ncbi:MAG: Dam family site-specific DNA-(adenine-N6)-methyltransferase [Acidobacteria bacterium]|nr:Dam family site-specific DNA-(adenine-N6)-methyltransferase [Acidobacteriota bacterium]
MQPLLRWIGGKQKVSALIGDLIRLNLNEGGRYVEPFLGGASVFLRLGHGFSLLGDSNPVLINFYECLQLDSMALMVAYSDLLAHSKSFQSEKDAFLQVRQEFNLSSKSGFESAAKFLYLNRTCFNGIWRVNRKGEFSTPFGARRAGNWPIDFWRDLGERFQQSILRCADYTAVVASAAEGDLVYLDPPYVGVESESFVRYGPRPFDRNDLCLLKDAVQGLADRNVLFCLSLNCSAVALEDYKDFKIDEVANGSGFVGLQKRARGMDLLIRNF